MSQVELVTGTGKKKKFEETVALRLLNYPNGSWKLPEGSNYKLKNGSLVKEKRHTGADKEKAPKPGTDQG